MVLEAWVALQRQRRSAAALYEAPIAQLTALFANANSTGSKPFTAEQFLLYHDRDEPHRRLPPEAASALLSLHNDALTTPLLLTTWSDVLAAAPTAPPTPTTRAYTNAERTLWLVAPTHERGGIRAALAVCADVRGAITVHDVDRPLVQYHVVVPPLPHATWIQSRLLLATTTQPET